MKITILFCKFRKIKKKLKFGSILNLSVEKKTLSTALGFGPRSFNSINFAKIFTANFVDKFWNFFQNFY